MSKINWPAGRDRGGKIFGLMLAMIMAVAMTAGAAAVKDGKITGLKMGRYYTVEVDGVSYYAKADGTLSKNISDAALLQVPEIKGVPAGRTTPKVTGTAQYPAEYSQLSEDYRLMIDRINALVDDHFENREYNKQYKVNRNLTGIAVGVVKDGRVFFFNRGYHESDQQKNVSTKTKVTENSVFQIASTSKPIAGFVLSRLSMTVNPSTGAPYVNLDDTVDKYSSVFKIAPYIDSDGTPVYPTLRQFTSHTSGFNPPKVNSTYTIDQMRADLEKIAYESKPGIRSTYTGYTYWTFANILTHVYYGAGTKKWYEDLLQDLFCKPLGLESTTTKPWDDADIYRRMALAHLIDGAPSGLARSSEVTTAGGAVSSTTADLILWLAMLTGDFIPAGATELHEAAKAGVGWFRSNRAVPGAALSPYESNSAKLGGAFRELFPRPANAGQRYGTVYQHSGSLPGYSTRKMACLKTNTAVVVLINNRGAKASQLACNIMDRALNAAYHGNTPYGIALSKFDDRIWAYAAADKNIEAVIDHDLTLGALVNIPKPKTAGVTLTLRSANPAAPVTLTRGVKGNLFALPDGATLILKDIIIDGGGDMNSAEEEDDEGDDDDDESVRAPAAKAAAPASADGGGTLVRVNKGGAFIMNSGAVLRNNINPNNGGAIHVLSGGAFTMNGGEISGNTTTRGGGGVHLSADGTFTMRDGKIINNTANGAGGGVDALGAFTMNGGKINSNSSDTRGGGVSIGSAKSVFTMQGGEIVGNTAKLSADGVRHANGTVNINSGVIAGTGRNTANLATGKYGFNAGGDKSPNNAVIIAWAKPGGDVLPAYRENTSTNLTALPDKAASAVWMIKDGKLGVSYKNGANTGFIDISTIDPAAASSPASTITQGGGAKIKIQNPYAAVNWATWKQYKAAHHTHTTWSDGKNSTKEMLIDKYGKGYDIVAITDHDIITNRWDSPPNPPDGNLKARGMIGQRVNAPGGMLPTDTFTAAEAAAIRDGTFQHKFPDQFKGKRPQSNGMIGMGHCNEWSDNGEPAIALTTGETTKSAGPHHMNTFFANLSPGAIPRAQRTMAKIADEAGKLGGIGHINHPNWMIKEKAGDPNIAKRYIDIFMASKFIVGMEVLGPATVPADITLWDDILTETVPLGRFVWGFSNDDAHSTGSNGHSYNMMLMPELTEAATKTSMVTGAFYAVSRRDRRYEINGRISDKRPGITSIAVNEASGTITIAATDFSRIEWIADGRLIHTGATLNIYDLHADIGSYVRAAVIGSGVAYTQPFGIIKPAGLTSAKRPSAPAPVSKPVAVAATPVIAQDGEDDDYDNAISIEAELYDDTADDGPAPVSPAAASVAPSQSVDKDAPVAAQPAPAAADAPSGAFTVIPNPAVRSAGGVTFYWQGGQLKSGAVLPIFDSSGKIVSGVEIKDSGKDGVKRRVGVWYLRDLDGRAVPAGKYTVRGVLTASDGEDVRVRLSVEVR